MAAGTTEASDWEQSIAGWLAIRRAGELWASMRPCVRASGGRAQQGWNGTGGKRSPAPAGCQRSCGAGHVAHGHACYAAAAAAGPRADGLVLRLGWCSRGLRRGGGCSAATCPYIPPLLLPFLQLLPQAHCWHAARHGWEGSRGERAVEGLAERHSAAAGQRPLACKRLLARSCTQMKQE